VNTIGTRRPRLDLTTLLRSLGKLKSWMRRVPGPSTASLQNPRVLSPVMWPSFGSRLSRWLNRRLLSRALTPVLRQAASPPVAVTTIPLVADLIGVLPVRRWVYYCVDDFSQWPGYDGGTLREMEERLVARVDAVVAVSETLRERVRGLGKESELLTHGIDPDFWATETETACPRLDGLKRPLFVFWGLIDRRMDLALVRALAEEMTAGTVVLVGPEDNPDPELGRIPRVARVGSVPFEQLPSVAKQAAVLLMPYADLPVTRAMQPLKLKEYLATGKPVVVRDLPSTRAWADCLDLASSPGEFAASVLRRAEGGIGAEQQSARGRLADETWKSKAARFAAWLDGPAPSEIA
jgi:glycosyltransferase involved in cell wall biosynthesis